MSSNISRTGRVPIISDLTNVLLIGDIIALGPDGSVDVVECKNTHLPDRLPSSGRLARQRLRGENAAQYLRDSMIPYGDEVTRMAGALHLPADRIASAGAASLVAMDTALPAARPEWLTTAYRECIRSPTGIGIVAITPGDFLIIARRTVLAGDAQDTVLADLMPLRKSCLATHWEFINNPLPHCRSVLSYLVDWELREAPLENGLVLLRLVDLAIFEEPGDDGLGFTLLDDLGLEWRQADVLLRFSSRFIDEVMAGPVSAVEMLDCLLEQLHQARDDDARFAAEPQADRDAADRGVGEDVRYSTVYPGSGGRLVRMMSAADAGLDPHPLISHVEVDLSTRGVRVFLRNGDVIDADDQIPR